MITDYPMISVIIPSYNHAHLIGRAIKSVLEQDWEKLEVIVVDNSSSDGTKDVIEKFKDDRIQFIEVSNNGVIAISRNVGIRAAKGEWIAFLDSDDWWTKNKIRTCSKYFHNQDLIYHRLEIVGAKERILPPRYIRSWKLLKPVIQHILISGNPIATSSVLLRKDLLKRAGGFDEQSEIIAAEDYELWLKISVITDQFYFIPEKLGYYQYNQQSVSRRDMSVPMREVQKKYIHNVPLKKQNAVWANSSYAAGRFAWQHNDYMRARSQLLISAMYGRTDIRIKSFLMLPVIYILLFCRFFYIR